MSIYRELRVAVVDDEEQAREQARSALQDFGQDRGCSIETVLFADCASFLDAVGTETFDIILMDIYLQDGDGTVCARALRDRDKYSLIIFLTTSLEHMPQAFACHAFEYITKPVTEARLHQVLDDALDVLPPRRPSIEVICGRSPAFLFLEEIASVVSDAHYLQISMTDGRMYRTRMKLDAFFERIGQDARFLRINKGVAVNADHVTELGNGSCRLSNGTCLPIRRRDGRRIESELRRCRFDAIRATQKQYR